MEREQLRTTQAPLKERYREDPDAAVVTLSAERYCIVFQTLSSPPALSATLRAA